MTVVARNQEVEPGIGAEQERLVIGSAEVAGGEAPSSVLIAPWGEVRSASGDFIVDEEGGRLVIEAFQAHGADLPIDYEHQSLGGHYASPSGQAPAAGWIKDLRFVTPEDAGGGESGLFAEVAWTEPGRQTLAAREYRYLSPVVLVRKGDRRVVALHSAALTNKPAIVNARPIVNRVCPISGADPAGRPAFEVLRLRLGLPDDCGLGEVLTAAEQKLAGLESEAGAAAAKGKVAAAAAAGKLTPAMRDWAMKLALCDPAAFETWAATAPVVVMLGRTQAPQRVTCGGRDRSAVIASALANYHAEPALAELTSESAWIDEALREAGFEPPDKPRKQSRG
ncbi:MAG TPA: phage protease [Phycisphaerae bacterium]|nr:phage protease [Phycisphaerae bacterium]